MLRWVWLSSWNGEERRGHPPSQPGCPFFWRLSCWLAGRGREGLREGTVPAALARPGVRTNTPVPRRQSPMAAAALRDPPQVNALLPALTALAPCVCAKSLQSCPTLCDHMDRSPPCPLSMDSPSRNTGGGCHSLLPGPDTGIDPASPVSLALARGFFFWGVGVDP